MYSARLRDLIAYKSFTYTMGSLRPRSRNMSTNGLLLVGKTFDVLDLGHFGDIV